MNSLSQENAVAQGEPETRKETEPPARLRPKNTRQPLPEDYKNLCALCRSGKLFAVQEWFKTHKYNEPERYDCKHWPIGIAIEKEFHSLAEVLLQSGVPADARALQRAAEYRNHDIVNLLFQFGAKVEMVEFEHIVLIGDKEIIGNFIERGADLVTGYPIAKGLIRLTRLFLGIYKSNIEKHPELQFQADMALRHFCSEGNLRGVSLLMWLGANPRAKVPCDAGDDEEYWETALEAGVCQGQLDIIKRLKPNAATDNANALLRRSIFRRNMDLIRYWVSLGADINWVDEDRDTNHSHVVISLEWALDPRSFWYGREATSAKQFANEWFSSGATWNPQARDHTAMRKVLARLSYMESYEFIKLLLAKQVMSADVLGEILDTPKLRQHLHERRSAIAALVPRIQKWVKAEERKRQIEQQKQAAARRASSHTRTSPSLPA